MKEQEDGPCDIPLLDVGKGLLSSGQKQQRKPTEMNAFVHKGYLHFFILKFGLSSGVGFFHFPE